MNKEKLEEKVIKFYEDELLGVKDEQGDIWLAVNKTCKNLGFDEDDCENQARKLGKDEVLNSLSVKKYGMNVNRPMWFIHEKGVTLWLAKINVTKNIKDKYPELSKKLMKYQLECSEVLHKAFFETDEQKEKLFDELGLTGEIKELRTEVNELTVELKGTQDKLSTLIDNSTINSRQASKLLIHAKDRVNCLLGGANSKEYKKNSRTYFKNLWLELCERFETNSYKDLNPLNFNDAVTFVSGWSYR